MEVTAINFKNIIDKLNTFYAKNLNEKGWRHEWFVCFECKKLCTGGPTFLATYKHHTERPFCFDCYEVCDDPKCDSQGPYSSKMAYWHNDCEQPPTSSGEDDESSSEDDDDDDYSSEPEPATKKQKIE